MSVQRWSRTLRSVNSKLLLYKVTDFVEEGFNDTGVYWDSETHRESFVEIVEDWLEEIQEDGDIIQYKVVCDQRNNSSDYTSRGIYYFDIYYRQINCLNQSHIRYEIHYVDDPN